MSATKVSPTGTGTTTPRRGRPVLDRVMLVGLFIVMVADGVVQLQAGHIVLSALRYRRGDRLALGHAPATGDLPARHRGGLRVGVSGVYPDPSKQQCGRIRPLRVCVKPRHNPGNKYVQYCLQKNLALARCSLIRRREPFTASRCGVCLAALLHVRAILPWSLPRLSAASPGGSTAKHARAASSPAPQPASARATGPGPLPGAV